MTLVGVFAAPLAVVFAILAFYWWFNYVVLERAVQRALSSPRDDSRGGCLVPVLALAAFLTLVFLFLLESGGL
jgi:hypothetical protein